MTAATTSEGAGRARRWLSRALAVAGGAVAATAAAWLVSTATASASTEDTHLPELRTEKVSEVGDALTGAAREATAGQDEPAGSGSGEAKPFGRDAFRLPDGKAAGAMLKDSAQRFWDERLAKPVNDTLDTVSGLVRAPERPRELGKEFWNILKPGGDDLVDLPQLPGLPDNAATDGTSAQPAAPVPSADTALPLDAAAQSDAADRSLEQRAADREPDGSGAAAPSGATHPAAHDDRSAPESPLRLPTPKPSALPTSTGGTMGGSHIDGPLFGVPAGSLSAFHEAEAGAVRLGARHLPTQPGAQPGVTPD